ncbi:alpha/beta hydrolase [Defluviimonas sp. WL0024]|uniref:Alpha/beta hydrolase n=2 Tax=Albidovulum TaxID=205889 RepID=A0ABT3J5N8_9RHOB|nr:MULTISPECIES: alpha/beta hydrolase [Defluviimonas]MCU9849164.1 alpha/beta hydrolase [Defluviimonas sp. WL0024]MCW3782709.1 alpha/beta hydrolase [Defluviimonas salinarum]
MPLDERAGHPTFWQSFGKGARPALAIHCSLAASSAWAGVASRLTDRVTLTAFDLPGHGKSADWSGEGDFLTLATRIAASFVEEPVDLIGHSYGALVAMRLARAAPEAIRTLTLIEPVLFAAAKGSPEWEEHLAAEGPFRAALAAGDDTGAARAFMQVWGAGEDWDRMEPRARARIVERIRLICAGDPATLSDSAGFLKPDALERLDMPVLLIRGEQSPPVIERIAENIAARLPDVGVATVPGAGHMVPITHPDETAGLTGVNLDRG